MGFRFRKSIGSGLFKVNLSKSGIGYSVGTKGARITKTANGRTRKTVGIAGTGISYTSERLSSRLSESGKHRRRRQQVSNNDQVKIGRKFKRIFFGACAAIIIPFSLLLLIVPDIVAIGIGGLSVGAICAFASHKNKRH